MGIWFAEVALLGVMAGATVTGAQPEEPGRAPIERSLVLVPERAGEFRLVEFEDYPGRPEMGVGARYVHDAFPEVVLSLFIYPFGAVARDEALDSLVDRVRDELRAVEEQGRYEALSFGDAIDVDLQRVEADGTLLPPRAGVLGRSGSLNLDVEGAERDLDKTLAAEMTRVEEHVRAATDPDVGRRAPIRFRHGGQERQSAAFLFHRSLYAFKGRVSSSMDISPDNFDRLANRAMALIIPAAEVRNTGACASLTIEIDPDAGKEAGALILAAKLAVAEVQAERRNCVERLDESVPDGMRGLAIDVAAVFEDAGAEGEP